MSLQKNKAVRSTSKRHYIAAGGYSQLISCGIHE